MNPAVERPVQGDDAREHRTAGPRDRIYPACACHDLSRSGCSPESRTIFGCARGGNSGSGTEVPGQRWQGPLAYAGRRSGVIAHRSPQRPGWDANSGVPRLGLAWVLRLGSFLDFYVSGAVGRHPMDVVTPARRDPTAARISG